MINPDQIPPEVVKAALLTDERLGMREVLAAALNAWPRMECRPTFDPSRIILPLPTEASDE